MSIAAKRQDDTQTAQHSQLYNGLPFIQQVTMMTWRSLLTMARTPSVVLPALFISGFFLFVYEATLGDASNSIPGISNVDYIAFILPLSVISASLSGAGIAGQNLVRDIESGYFDKLMLTPISRGALILSQILGGAMVLALQTIVIISIGMLLGLDPATGIGGLAATLGFAMLVGVGFAGFSVGVALQSGNAGATQSAGFLFFPLTFLTATFVPVDLLGGWLKTVAQVNPITYILEAMREILITGWDAQIILQGLLACAVLGIIPYLFAMISLRSRTARK